MPIMTDQPTSNPLAKTTPAPAGLSRPGVANGPERWALLRWGVALLRRWGRDTFNRDSLMSSLRALVWVVPLTLLIWIYAEREQRADGTARFQIVVKSVDPTQVAQFVAIDDQDVRANLKGPKARLAAALEKLDPRSNTGPVQIVIDGNREPGQYEIDILAQIQKDYRLDGSGITVVDCHPRHVRVDVDALQEVELAVKADPQARFLAPPTFEPPRVKVTAPASALKAVKGEPYAKANVPSLPPGLHKLRAVPLTVEGLDDPRATIHPATVSATVEVGQADVPGSIASLPVFPIIAGDMKNYTLKYNEFLSSVPVYGPPDKIRQLEADALTPRPEVRFKVTDSDIVARRGTRDLEYVLPEGIHRGDGAPKSITFEILPRDPS